jgi:hypothetical protein
VRAQECGLNIIISIDNKIISTVTQMKLMVDTGSEKMEVYCNYTPGRAECDTLNLRNLQSKDLKSVMLSFSYSEYYRKSEKVRFYNIDLSPQFFKNSFYILYLYNLDKNKYKKLFQNSDQSSYVYEFDSSNGSMRRIRTKHADCD